MAKCGLEPPNSYLSWGLESLWMKMSASFFPEIGADEENDPHPDSCFEYVLFFLRV